MIWLALLISSFLWGQTPGAVAAGASPFSTFYSIDASTRGLEIYSTFSSPAMTHVLGSPQLPAVWFQTTLTNSIPYRTYSYITPGGMIPYVQTLTDTPNHTLFIVSYLPVAAGNVIQHLVVPIEQIQALVYYPSQYSAPGQNSHFQIAPIPSTVPYYSVDPTKRAADIVAATLLLMGSPFKLSSSQVWIQMTLTGPFRPINVYDNGLLQNITAISALGTLIQITFLPNNNQSTPITVFVPPEEILRIIYVRDLAYP
jgi:hypothetical protein